MTHLSEDARPAAAADIAYRRRALKVNGGIYGRRHGPELLPLLAGSTIRGRFAAAVEWLASEPHWAAADARRISGLSAEIGRFGRLRPQIAEVCDWHAARLAELVSQYRAVALLEAKHCRGSRWLAAPKTSWHPPKRARVVRESGRAAC
jgi:hypothetical protein